MRQDKHGWGAAAVAVIWAATLVLAGCGGGGGGGETAATQAPNIGRPGADYFPLGEGDRWSYLQGDTLQNLRVQGMRTVDGQAVTVVASSDPDDGGEIYIQKSSSAVVELPSPGAQALRKAIGPLTRYHLPFVAGDRYTTLNRSVAAYADLDGDGRADDVTLRIDVEVLGFESLDTALARFTDVARVKTSFTFTVRASSSGQTVTDVSTSEEWLAPGVGLVRSVQRDSGDGTPTETQQVLYRYRTAYARAEQDAPVVASTSPAALTPDRLLSSMLEIRFNEDMDRQAAVPTLSVTNAAGDLLPGRSFWDDARTLRHVIDAALTTGVYTVALPGSFEDLSGNVLAATSWTLSIDRSGPTVVAADPAIGATAVSVAGAIRITMDEAFQADQVQASLSWNGSTVPVDVSTADRVLTLQAREPLLLGATYQWSLRELVDTLGNRPPSDVDAVSGSFTTDAGRFRLPLQAPVALRRVMGALQVDLNGDGRSDWVLALAVGSTPWPTELQVLTATAGGTWATPSTIWAGGCSVEGMTSGDFNGDGRVDLAMATGCGTYVLLQDAAGGFGVVTVIATGERATYWPRALRQAGRAQPAVLQAERLGGLQANRLRSWRWEAGTGFTPGSFIEHGLWDLRDLAVADLDGDGLDDIVVSGDVTPGVPAVMVLRQAADGSFATPVELMRGVSCFSAGLREVTVIDFDRDGRLDIVVTGVCQDGTATVFPQQSDGRFGSGRALSIPGQRLDRVRLADMDGDGRLDLVGYVAAQSGVLAISLQRADGSFEAPERYEAATDADQHFWLGDWNTDGRPDVLIEQGWLMQRGITASAVERATQSLWRAAWPRATGGVVGTH